MTTTAAEPWTTARHPLARLLRSVVAGSPPDSDGGWTRVSPWIPTVQAMVAFTGHTIVAVSYDVMTQAEAREIGLVNKVFAPEELMTKTLDVARVIGGKGKASLRAAKETIGQGLNTDLATGLAIERDAFALCLASPDAQEGTTAFL